MKTLFLALLLTSFSFAADSQAPSNEEMKARLDGYVKENQEASMSIEPLIKKLNNILSPEKRLPASEKPETKKP